MNVLFILEKVMSNMKNVHLQLLPLPQKVQHKNGEYRFNKVLKIHAELKYQEIVKQCIDQVMHRECFFCEDGYDIMFVKNESLHEQGYKLDVRTEKITIEYCTSVGINYGIVTVEKMMIQFGDNIPCVDIEDYPDIEVRGVLLDISRDRVPKIETIFYIIDILYMLKVNHFELYIEGFSFDYLSFSHICEDGNNITCEEMRRIDTYCKERFIDFVPNQNCLGHMTSWLATDKYNDLQEIDEGIEVFGKTFPPSTINPLDKRSLELVEKMTDDILPNFTSNYFNVNLDEPFELGKGKSKEKADEFGIGKVYLDYVKKIHKMVSERNKKMLMWGDVVSNHPEILDELPKDITLLEWGYDRNSPFERNAKRIAEAGFDFYLCPGTNGWLTIAGRTENMLKNIESANVNAKKFGAKGVLNTDWGDMGHWQHMPVSFAGYSYCAGLSWNVESRSCIHLEKYLDTYIYKDKNNVMGKLSLELGRYDRYESFRMYNATVSSYSLIMGITPEVMSGEDRIKIFDYERLCEFLGKIKNELNNHNMQCENALFYQECYMNAIDMIRLGADVRHFIDNEESMAIVAKRRKITKLHADLNEMIIDYRKLWKTVSKVEGLRKSIMNFLKLEKEISQYLNNLQIVSGANNIKR